MVKFINSSELAGLIQDGDTIMSTGMMLASLPEEPFQEIENSFLGKPSCKAC